jgi:hypothetical protein
LQILKEKLISGADWSFDESIENYSSVDYDAKYILKRGTADPFEIDSIDQDSGFSFLVDAVESADLAAGFYVCTLQVITKVIEGEEGQEIKIINIDQDVVEILPNVQNVLVDPRSHALQMVEKLRTQLLVLSDQVYNSMALEDGKSLILNKMNEVRNELQIWESKAGLTKGGRVRRIKFTNNFEIE